jgi:segregation and condensation protein A
MAAAEQLALAPMGPVPVIARGASVTFDRSARPDHAALVQLEVFEGPLALLLSLIEQRQLDVLTVPLGDLCGAYLDALAALPGAQLPHASAFISVASQLILIKSRAMLPRPRLPGHVEDEGIDPEAALRERLLLYRRYRDAAGKLSDRLASGIVTFHREAASAVASAKAGARAPKAPPLDPAALRDSLAAMFRLVPEPAPPPEVVPRAITVEERAAVIRRALRSAPVIVLQDLLTGVRDRVVVAITFLAMLELVKQREVSVEQQEPWGPIVCRPVTKPRAVAIDIDATEPVSSP